MPIKLLIRQQMPRMRIKSLFNPYVIGYNAYKT